MKKLGMLFFILSCTHLTVFAQGKFTCTLSSDSIQAGNYIRLTYLIENLEASFEPPDFKGVKIVGGPNTSSQMSIINGKMSSRKKYEYILFLEDAGEVYLSTATLVVSSKTIEIEPIRMVVDAGQGPLREPHIDQSREWTKTLEIDGNGEVTNKEGGDSKPKRVIRRI